MMFKRVAIALLFATSLQAAPIRVEKGELITATPDDEPSTIDPTNAPKPDITKFLKKCRSKCDNPKNLPSYMENHPVSEEHCYLGCHWGYEMLCQEIGCQTGILHKVPTPRKPKPKPLPKPKPDQSSSSTGGATGGLSTGSATGGVNAITGGMSEDEAQHARSVEGVVNGWTSSSTGGSSTGGSSTGGATGGEVESTATGSESETGNEEAGSATGATKAVNEIEAATEKAETATIEVDSLSKEKRLRS
jgi:hypothetical protein